jgi:TRAP-type uncharacterized transport system fused permease subunit
MHVRIALIVSLVIVAGAVAGTIKGKLSYTEAGATLVSVLTFWSDPPKGLDLELPKTSGEGDRE